MRSIYLCSLLLLFSLFFARPLFAAGEFSTNYHSSYEVSKVGTTQVSHTIELTNNLSHIYATSYTLSITGKELSHFAVTDETGPVPYTLDQSSQATTIQIEISRPSIGQHQTKTLHVSYQSEDLVEKIGDTLSINIPRLAKSNEANSYIRTVRVPATYNSPTHLLPTPDSTALEGDYQVFTYLGHTSDALSLTFGDLVTYELTLNYLLKNPELQNIDSELALPPDTSYQQIVLDSLSPPPLSIRIDPDGNYLARYTLKPQEKLGVTAKLFATISPTPRFTDPSSTTPRLQSLSPYWDTKSDVVQNLGLQLKTPRNIYTYLTDNFVYNYDLALRGPSRLGAVAALNTPTQAVCTEFTDTFIALSRAIHISAREINGYAYSTNPSLRPLTTTVDVLHAWPEYYDADQKIWTQVDPTWGQTSGGVDYFRQLDFSHITFVRRGVETTYPLPAGVYKDEASQKTISVAVSSITPSPSPNLVVEGQLVKNTGNALARHPEAGYIPPYGEAQLPNTSPLSFYDKIKAICVKLFSKFWPPRSGSL